MAILLRALWCPHLLDLSAAFDTVDYELLTHRLSEIGIKGKALQWLKSFLEERSFQVKEDNLLSDRKPLKCRVQQGLSLSPTLFNVYMQPLADVV